MKAALAAIFALLLSLPAAADAAGYTFTFRNSDQITLRDSALCTNKKAIQQIIEIASTVTGHPPPAAELAKASEAEVLLHTGKRVNACWMMLVSASGRPFALVGGEDGKGDLIPLQLFKRLTGS